MYGSGTAPARSVCRGRSSPLGGCPTARIQRSTVHAASPRVAEIRSRRRRVLYEECSSAREFRNKDPLHDVGYAVFPFYAVGHALARTLDRFKDAGEGFNRNLTQHRIGMPHTEPNLLMVLLLLAGLLREVERLLNRHDAREEAAAA